MAQLTPLSKGLVGLLVVGVMASAAWHLALKERFAARQSGTAIPVVAAPDPVPREIASPPPVPIPVAVPQPTKPEYPVAQPKPQPRTAPAKPTPADADPWANLSMDKKGNKP